MAANPFHLEAASNRCSRASPAPAGRPRRGAEYPAPLLVHGDAASPARAWCAEEIQPRRSCAATAPAARVTWSSDNQVRLDHFPGLVALLALLHHDVAPDGPGTDLPRERRRPGVHPRRPARLRVARRQEGRRHRPRLLPPPRSRRGRRPVVHAAADVRPHRAEALGAQALHRVPHRSSRHHHRGGRAGPQGLPAAAGAGLHRGARGQGPARRVDHGPGLPRQARGRDHHLGHPGGREADLRRLRRPAGRLHRPPEGDPRCSVAPPLSPTARSTGARARSSRSARC